MGHSGVRVRSWRTPDTALAAVLFLLALGTLHMSAQGADAWSVGGVALSTVLAIVLSQAHTRPWPALAAITGLFLVAQASYGLVPVFAMIVIAAVFRAASGDGIRRVWAASVASVIAVAVDLSAQLTRDDSWTNSAYLVMATVVLGSAAAGDAVRSRRAYVREVEDRARRAEYSRDQNVQRRIAEERLSIARDVHDLVAHHLAVVSVQAEVANHLIGSQPALATEAIGLVRGAARSALGELGSLIGVLRGGSNAPLEPAPTLAQLPELMASFETTGLQVRRTEHGTARPLPVAVDLAAYRLVQESLTNAHKHGSGQADVHITYDPDRVVIDVVNPTVDDEWTDAAPDSASDAMPDARPDARPDAASTGAGHGLLGMRERVAAVGGTVRIERTDDDHTDAGKGSARRQFRVLATIPAGGV